MEIVSVGRRIRAVVGDTQGELPVGGQTGRTGEHGGEGRGASLRYRVLVSRALSVGGVQRAFEHGSVDWLWRAGIVPRGDRRVRPVGPARQVRKETPLVGEREHDNMGPFGVGRRAVDVCLSARSSVEMPDRRI